MMDEKDKAKTTIPESPAQKMLQKVDIRDRRVRAFELIILFAIVLFNVFMAIRIQYVIDQNHRDTINARNDSFERENASKERQEGMKSYIKCLGLIRYDNTQKQLSTRKGVEAALDKCVEAN